MIELTVNDMTCGHCANTVTRAIQAIDPVASVEIDLPNKRVRVESTRAVDQLTLALDEAGYPAAPVEGAGPPAAKAGCCVQPE